MNRLEQLIALRDILQEAIDTCDSKRDLAALAKQFRETIKEIEDIEGTEDNHDEISEIIAGRAADGKSGAVRKNRAKVQTK